MLTTKYCSFRKTQSLLKGLSNLLQSNLLIRILRRYICYEDTLYRQ